MVEHTLRILKVLSEANTELGLKEISERAGVGRTSTFRILFTLCKAEYVHRTPPTGRYRLSARLMELARRPLGDENVVRPARPFLERLHGQFNETVNLAVFQDGEIVYVEIIESSRAFRMTASVGSRVPMHSTALGKAIAAFLPKDVLEVELSRCSWTRFTPHTLTSRRKFLKTLAEVRRRGYALDNEETELGAACVAAPILDSQQHAVAAISVSGPSQRIRLEEKAIVRELKGATDAISRAIVSR